MCTVSFQISEQKLVLCATPPFFSRTCIHILFTHLTLSLTHTNICPPSYTLGVTHTHLTHVHISHKHIPPDPPHLNPSDPLSLTQTHISLTSHPHTHTYHSQSHTHKHLSPSYTHTHTQQVSLSFSPAHHARTHTPLFNTDITQKMHSES